MKNEEYSQFLEENIIKLNEFRNKFSVSLPFIIQNNSFNEALYYLSLSNKATELIDGYILMMEDKNLTCLAILIRVQLDNCMRILAGNIVEDKETYFSNFRNPEIRLNKMKDVNGKKLTDANLRKYLNAFDENFGKTYALTSEFVHFSGSSLESILEIKDNGIHLDIGNIYKEKPFKTIYEYTKAFLYFLDLHFEMVQEMCRQKKTDANIKNNSKEYS